MLYAWKALHRHAGRRGNRAAAKNSDFMTRVLFVNTRSSLGADVAVHLTLIKNLDPARCEVTVATNSRAVDVARTLQILRDVPGVRVVVLNLGYELTGKGRA